MIAINKNSDMENNNEDSASEYCHNLFPIVKSELEGKLHPIEGIRSFMSIGCSPSRLDIDYVIEDNCDSYEFQTYELKK